MKNAPMENVENRIYFVRRKKVMLDSDLAQLYGVSSKILIQAVKRNKERFPADFMYQLTSNEVTDLRSQFVTSKKGGRGGRRYAPYVFTEQGVAMLSSILNSPRAIAVNIEIMRTFVRIREVSISYDEIKQKIDELEKKYDMQFQVAFKAIKLLIDKIKGDENKRF